MSETKKLTQQEILEIMKKSPIMTISVSNDDRPHSSVLLFAIDDDFTMYFVTHEDTYKAKALTKNPKISLSVWEHNKALIQVDGTTKKVSDSEKVNDILDKVIASSENVDDFWPPVLRIRNQNPYVAFIIKPTWLRATELTSKIITEKEPPHTEIKF